jgi:hypothetical protein
MTHRRLSEEELHHAAKCADGYFVKRDKASGDVMHGLLDHIAALESELAAVKAELAELQDVRKKDYASYMDLRARVRELEEVGQAFFASFPKHYHGFPSKLEWFEIHRLKQALGGGK